MTRAENRFYAMRAKHRAKHRREAEIKSITWGPVPAGKASAKDIGRTARTRKPCSCPLCGNYRKLYGKTRKEIVVEEGTE